MKTIDTEEYYGGLYPEPPEPVETTDTETEYSYNDYLEDKYADYEIQEREEIIYKLKFANFMQSNGSITSVTSKGDDK